MNDNKINNIDIFSKNLFHDLKELKIHNNDFNYHLNNVKEIIEKLKAKLKRFKYKNIIKERENEGKEKEKEKVTQEKEEKEGKEQAETTVISQTFPNDYLSVIASSSNIFTNSDEIDFLNQRLKGESFISLYKIWTII